MLDYDFWLDPLMPDVQRDMASAYEMHRTLAKMWPEERVLWRLSDEGQRLLVRSRHRWEGTVCPLGWRLIRQDYGYAHKATPGERVLFTTRLNPVVRRNGRAYFLTGPYAQTDWAKEMFRKNGLEMEDINIGNEAWVKAKHVHIGTTRFFGKATITNAALAFIAYCDGIGRARAWGCGLLSLKQVP